jgi:hypothetical protein
MSVFDHAESKTLVQSNVSNVMLQSEALKSSNREGAFTQLREILIVHQTLKSWFDDLIDQRIDKFLAIHCPPPMISGPIQAEIDALLS